VRPTEALVQATDGSFYGTTIRGGTYDYGTIYKIDATGFFTIVHSFSGGGDGGIPHAALMQAADGNLYGTTSWADTSAPGVEGGTIYKIDTAGILKTLYTFSEGTDCSFRDYPINRLIKGADGNLYGTTVGFCGEANQYGSVFTFDPTAGNLTTLHIFAGSSDGAWPYAGVIQASDGRLYGTTLGGGASDAGTVFRLTLAASTPEACKQGGWKAFVFPPGPFKNQGQCVSYFEHRK
jgi:uncharacterized repeat protein (TIGR03803 family)